MPAEVLVNARARIGRRLIRALDRLVAASDTVVLASFPDLEDNVVALLRSHEAEQRRVVVLADDVRAARRRADALGLKVSITRRDHVVGLWTFLRSHTVITTHGLFRSGRRPRGKRHVGLWHGEYIKAVGRVVGEDTHLVDSMVVSGNLSRLIRSAETGIDPSRVHVLGVPRADLLQVDSGPPPRVLMWAPTYRASTRGDQRQDTDPHSFENFVRNAITHLEPVLEEHDAELWLRLHPSAAGGFGVTSPRVVMADDQWLGQMGVTLYEALGATRALITDYSSIWIDYLNLDRPIVGAVPDLDEYEAGRGLLLKPYDWWLPGPTCRTVDSLVGAVRRILGGHDDESAHRRLIRSLLIESLERPATESVWDLVAEGPAAKSCARH